MNSEKKSKFAYNYPIPPIRGGWGYGRVKTDRGIVFLAYKKPRTIFQIDSTIS